MVHLQNRKMPSLATAWCYIGLAVLFSFLSWIKPLVGIILIPISIALATTGVLSIPRLSVFKVILISIASGLLPAVGIYLLTHLLSSAIAAFALAPAVLFFALTVRHRQSRSAGIRWMVVLLTLFYAGTLLLYVWEWKGALSGSVFQGLYNDAEGWFVNYFTPILEENSQLFEQVGMTDEVLPDLFKTILSMTPGFCILVIWSMAWFATVCLRWIFKHYVYGIDRFAKWPVIMTKPAAWLFLVTFIVSALPLNGNLWIITVIASNLYYIFIPGFFVVGCRAVKENFFRARGCGCFPFIIIGSIFMMPTIAFLFLAMTGAFRTIAPLPPSPILPPFSPDDPQNPQNPQNPDDQGGSPQ